MFKQKEALYFQYKQIWPIFIDETREEKNDECYTDIDDACSGFMTFYI